MPIIKYDDYQNLIHKLSYSWATTTGMEQEELFAEGNLVFCKALEEWNGSISKFSTFLVTCINNRFRNMASKKKEVLISGDYTPEGSHSNTPERSAEFWSEIHSLSSNAQEVVDIIMSGPSEVAQMGNLHDYLREAGWAWRTIFLSIKEIKSIF